MGTREDDPNPPTLTDCVAEMLYLLGEDPNRQGLVKTPERVARALLELTSGYRTDIENEVSLFDAEGMDQMVCQWNIPLYSLCEHHMLPFTGFAHVGYIPKDKVVGLSKMKRVVDHFARRLQIQERLTKEIAEYLDTQVKPRGVMVVVEAEHMCMTMRGVQAPGTLTTTSAIKGDYLDDPGTKEEFLMLLGHQRRER